MLGSGGGDGGGGGDAARAAALERAATALVGEDATFWLFGYASLIWRPDIPVAEAHFAALGGFSRRLYQASPDHRGTPARMGRVATLVAAPTWSRFAAAAAPAGAGDAPDSAALGARALALWLRDVDAGVGAAGDAPPPGGAAAAAMPALLAADAPVVFGTAYRVDAAAARATLAYLCVREVAGYAPRAVRVALAGGGAVRALVFVGEPRGAAWAAAPDEEIADVCGVARGPSGANADYVALLVAAMRARGVRDAHLERVWAALCARHAGAAAQARAAVAARGDALAAQL
jgi:cation transport regulator ChaC